MAGKRKYPGFVERRSASSYRISLCIDGVRYRKSVKARTSAEAALEAKRWEAELRNASRTDGASLASVTMSELLAQYERLELPKRSPGTQRAYRDCLKAIQAYFCGVLGDVTIDTIGAPTIQDYLAWRRISRLDGGNAGVSNRTLAKDRTMLHGLFHFAEVRDLVAANPVRKVDAPSSDPRRHCILTDNEYTRLLKASEKNPMLFTYLTVLGEAGLRCESEALHLRWEDIDFKAPFLTVVSGRDGHRTKSGKTRKVPMTPRLVAALKKHFRDYRFAEYPSGRSPYLFHHPNTRRHHTAGTRLATMRTSVANAARKAKLPKHFRQHDLRHRRVTTWLAEGKAAHLVMQAMGHSDLRTTMAYYSQTPEPLLQLLAPKDARTHAVFERRHEAS